MMLDSKIEKMKNFQEEKKKFINNSAEIFKRNNEWHDFSSYSLRKRFGGFLNIHNFESINNLNLGKI